VFWDGHLFYLLICFWVVFKLLEFVWGEIRDMPVRAKKEEESLSEGDAREEWKKKLSSTETLNSFQFLQKEE
jgi:hypothetical protein